MDFDIIWSCIVIGAVAATIGTLWRRVFPPDPALERVQRLIVRKIADLPDLTPEDRQRLEQEFAGDLNRSEWNKWLRNFLYFFSIALGSQLFVWALDTIELN